MKKALVVLSVIFLASGCAFEESAEYTTEPPVIVSSYPFLTQTPPPPAIQEIKPQPTDPATEIWRKGYWDYVDDAYTWVSGHYIKRPSPTAAWSPERWEKRAYGWAFVPGYWY